MMPNMMRQQQYQHQYDQVQAPYEQQQQHQQQHQQQQQQQYDAVQHHYDQTQQQYMGQYEPTATPQQFDGLQPQQFDASYNPTLDTTGDEFTLTQDPPTTNTNGAGGAGAVSSAAPNKTKRKGAFRHEHAIKYGLKVVSNTTPVTKVQCMFCVHYGREVSPDDTKRKMNVKGIKYWTPPFRTDHYAMHHDLQHKVMFQHYENCSAQERLHFFDPDTIHRLRHLVPRQPTTNSADGKDGKAAKRIKASTSSTSASAMSSRVDPVPAKVLLDPFKMMLPPTEIPHDMQTLVDIYLGHNYTPLEDKWKSLTTIASLVAQHVRNGFLETHIRRALVSGASKEEIIQVIMQSATFIGLPKTMDAMRVAHDVFLQGHPDAHNQNTVFL